MHITRRRRTVNRERLIESKEKMTERSRNKRTKRRWRSNSSRVKWTS